MGFHQLKWLKSHFLTQRMFGAVVGWYRVALKVHVGRILGSKIRAVEAVKVHVYSDFSVRFHRNV